LVGEAATEARRRTRSAPSRESSFQPTELGRRSVAYATPTTTPIPGRLAGVWFGTDPARCLGGGSDAGCPTSDTAMCGAPYTTRSWAKWIPGGRGQLVLAGAGLEAHSPTRRAQLFRAPLRGHGLVCRGCTLRRNWSSSIRRRFRLRGTVCARSAGTCRAGFKLGSVSPPDSIGPPGSVSGCSVNGGVWRTIAGTARKGAGEDARVTCACARGKGTRRTVATS